MSDLIDREAAIADLIATWVPVGRPCNRNDCDVAARKIVSYLRALPAAVLTELPGEVRNLFAVAHNLLVRMDDPGRQHKVAAKVDDLRRAVESVRPLIEAHFMNTSGPHYVETCMACGYLHTGDDPCRLDSVPAAVPVAACPCQHTTPCHAMCTCVTPHSSHGCSRCCTYGSKEQQVEAAQRLSAVPDCAWEGDDDPCPCCSHHKPAVPVVDVEKAANALYLSRKSIAEASSFEVLHPHMRELYRKDARAILSAGYVGSVSVEDIRIVARVILSGTPFVGDAAAAKRLLAATEGK